MREEDRIFMAGMVMVVLIVCACLVAIAWIRSRSRRDQARMRTEVQKSLLEKFNSTQELAEFLESPGSQRLLGDISLERRQLGIRERILGSVSAGVILSVFGLGFFILAVADNEKKLAVPGVLFLALGIGLLAAAAASHRLGKMWGLTNGSPASSQVALDRGSGSGDALS
jgi:Na+/melibiose symporter-like transporter